jgi:superfamily I DNA and/or RNA helicase
MIVLHKNTVKPSARCITINIERLHNVRLCQHRRCSQQILQCLERFITLDIPDILLIFLQKISDELSNLGEVQNEFLVITNQSKEIVDLMHSPWWLTI